MDIFAKNNREVIIYGVRTDMYGQKRFERLGSLPRWKANMRAVGYFACGYKQRFETVFAVSNSNELREAWDDLVRHSHRGPEDGLVFEDFLEYLVKIDEGMKF